MRKEYIAEFSQGKHGESTKPKEELIRCRDCQHLQIVATLEHSEEDVTNYYGCSYWHRPTDEDGYCHKAKRKEK